MSANNMEIGNVPLGLNKSYYHCWDYDEKEKLIIPYTEDTPLIYRGWNVFWTGWKSTHLSTRQAGQWLAWPPVELYKSGFRKQYVSCVPGECREYSKGEEFDIIPEGEQIPIAGETSQKDAGVMVEKGLERLKKLLDTVPVCGEIK